MYCRPIPSLTESDIKRFWGKVDKDGDCWQWIPDSGTYGFFTIGNHTFKAHRVSYTIKNGDPGGICVCHTCDNPGCVKPAHLWLGTYSDNIRDRDRNGSAKLNEHQVREILRSDESQEILAKRYHVNRYQIYSIRNGKTWGSVVGPRKKHRANANNKTAVKGVYATKYSYRAKVDHQGVRYYLGSFQTIKEAEKVVIKKRLELKQCHPRA